MHEQIERNPMFYSRALEARRCGAAHPHAWLARFGQAAAGAWDRVKATWPVLERHLNSYRATEAAAIPSRAEMALRRRRTILN